MAPSRVTLDKNVRRGAAMRAAHSDCVATRESPRDTRERRPSAALLGLHSCELERENENCLRAQPMAGERAEHDAEPRMLMVSRGRLGVECRPCEDPVIRGIAFPRRSQDRSPSRLVSGMPAHRRLVTTGWISQPPQASVEAIPRSHGLQPRGPKICRRRPDAALACFAVGHGLIPSARPPLAARAPGSTWRADETDDRR